MSIEINLESPESEENTSVHERILDTWGFGKGALSANDIFFDNHSELTRTGATQFCVEGGISAGIVEKICLSSDERLFRRSRARSRALKRRDSGIPAKVEKKRLSRGYENTWSENPETPEINRTAARERVALSPLVPY